MADCVVLIWRVCYFAVTTACWPDVFVCKNCVQIPVCNPRNYWKRPPLSLSLITHKWHTRLHKHARRFALSFTMGSCCFMGAFAAFRGPSTFFKGLLVRERLPFTAAYIGSIRACYLCVCNRAQICICLFASFVFAFESVLVLY